MDYGFKHGGKVYTPNATDGIEVLQGSTGACYYGRASWDHSTCITLRKLKGGK
jgi:hypothetical protein